MKEARRSLAVFLVCQSSFGICHPHLTDRTIIKDTRHLGASRLNNLPVQSLLDIKNVQCPTGGNCCALSHLCAQFYLVACVWTLGDSVLLHALLAFIRCLHRDMVTS